MLLLVLNGWRIQFREWRAERRSGQSVQLQPEDDRSSEQAETGVFTGVFSRSL